jgi:hypothetical protein
LAKPRDKGKQRSTQATGGRRLLIKRTTLALAAWLLEAVAPRCELRAGRSVSAAHVAKADAQSDAIVAAATAFLDILSDAQCKAAVFP